MLALDEYKAYAAAADKNLLRTVVTLAESENDHMEYFKRLALRRLLLWEDITEKQTGVMLRRLGVLGAVQTAAEISVWYGVTREFIRQLEAKATFAMRNPRSLRLLLQNFTTREDFVRAIRLTAAGNPAAADRLQAYLPLFDNPIL